LGNAQPLLPPFFSLAPCHVPSPSLGVVIILRPACGIAVIISPPVVSHRTLLRTPRYAMSNGREFFAPPGIARFFLPIRLPRGLEKALGEAPEILWSPRQGLFFVQLQMLDYTTFVWFLGHFFVRGWTSFCRVGTPVALREDRRVSLVGPVR